MLEHVDLNLGSKAAAAAHSLAPIVTDWLAG